MSFGIFGLIIAYAFVFLLFTHIIAEFSYDKEVPGSENIYRIATIIKDKGESVVETAKSQMPLGEALVSQIPGVNAYSRILDEECLFINGDIKFNRQKVYWVDEKFPEMFSLEMVQGNAGEALEKPGTMIISEDAAQRFFGTEPAVGKSLVLNEGIILRVSGIFKKPKILSHFEYDYLISFNTIVANGWNNRQNNWETNAFYTYIRLDPGVDPADLEKGLNEFAQNTYKSYHEKEQQVELIAQPVESIHLHSHLDDELSKNSKIEFVMILALLGLMTLCIAWLNFSGMVTSRYLNDQTSLLLNRVFGASGFSVIHSVITEVLLLNILAVGASTGIALIFGNWFFGLLELPYSTILMNLENYLILTGAVLICGLLFSSAGPVYVLTKKMAQSGFKNQIGMGKTQFRQQVMLVIFQYAFSIFLIVFLFVVFQQISFFKESNPGYDKSQLLVIHSPRSLIANPERISKGRDFLARLNNAGLTEAGSFCSDIPGEPVQTDYSGFWVSPQNQPDWQLPVSRISIDEGYVETLGLKLVAGTNFSPVGENNRDKLILNECAVKALGFDNPQKAIGTLVKDRNNRSFTISGVISDFHQEGMQEEIRPLVFNYGYGYLFGYCALPLIQVSPELVETIKSEWEAVYPDDPFDYFFLDEQFNHQYQNEVLFFRMCIIFGVISILIACYGLFGISMETVARRRKEIGVRKVNGATIGGIIFMLNQAYMKWILAAWILACPFAWMAINRWLENFAYRTTVSWWFFCMGWMIAVLIAIVTVSWQSWKAATRNPVEALRYE